MSDKVDFKLKLSIRDKEGHFILIKCAKYQDEISVNYVCRMSVNLISLNIH
jgi:hypothetical protein